MFCGKCGKEVPTGYMFCMHCGAKVEQTNEQTNEQALEAVKTIKPKINRKKIAIVTSVIVMVAIIGLVAYIFIGGQGKKGFYNNIAWGTSLDAIQKIVEKNTDNIFEQPVNDEKTKVMDSVSDFYGFKGVTALVTYDCGKEQKLQKVMLTIVNGDDSSYSDDIIIETIIDDFNKLYGEPEDNLIGKSWTTDKSKIGISYLADGLICVDYEDIAIVED